MFLKLLHQSFAAAEYRVSISLLCRVERLVRKGRKISELLDVCSTGGVGEFHKNWPYSRLDLRKSLSKM